MFELIMLYRWTIPAGVIMALVLSWLGIHLSARGRSLQSFCVSQGIVVGLLIGIGLEWTPVWMSLISAVITWLISDRLARYAEADRSTVFGAIFIVLIALSYLVTRLFPGLESHSASIFFGELSTLGDHEAKHIIPIGLIAASILWKWKRELIHDSFNHALFGEETAKLLEDPLWRYIILSISLVILTVSVQYLGFLFTVACLYLPTVLLGFLRREGIFYHFFLAGISSTLSVIIGFLLSLAYPTLPTVPTIIMIQLFMIGFWILLLKGVKIST